MFGYVKPNESELKVKEAQFYKAAYCGLCRTLGKEVGGFSRITLSYDFTFLALIRSAVQNDKFEITTERCAFKGCSKRPVVSPNPSLIYASRSGALLASLKIEDDARDSKGAAKIKAKLKVPYGKRLKRKAIKGYDLPEKRLNEALDSLSSLEKEKCAIPDRCADCSGEMLSAIFAHGIEDEAKAILLEKIGFHIGRYIYLLDAADDYEDDIKKGSFNPFALSGSLDRIALRNSLEAELAIVDDLVARIHFTDSVIENIIKNVITYGCEAVMDKILTEPETTDKRSKGTNEK